MKKTVFVLLFLMTCSSWSFARSKHTLQMKGSDTMVNLAQSWAESYMVTYPTRFIAVTGGGSGTGISGLINKSCDIAMSSRPIKSKEIALAAKRKFVPVELIVGLDGIAVIVHPKNPVKQLTLEQLAQIFTGKITNWQEVGGKAGKIVLLSREVNSGTHVYFKEHVLRHNEAQAQDEFAQNALMLPSSQAIADEVAGNVNAIGYYGMGYISAKQKALAIAANKKDYLMPTIANVRNGKYPISRPLFIYTQGQPQGDAKDFIDFVLSPKGQAIVAQTDFVPVR